jgi:hypothetical protein
MEWRSVSRADLAEHLKRVEVLDSEALGGASLYRCQGKEGESVAISLPGGETGLINNVHFEIPASLKRRRAQGENTPHAPRDE